MDRKQIAISGIVLAVVIVIVLITFQEVAQEYEAARLWCHSHNGTLYAPKDKIMCKLPNGTVTKIPQNP